MADQKISELAAAAALDGSESVEVVQGGVNVKTTTQDIADLGGGGGAVDSVNGQTGVVVLDAGDVGADPAGTAAAILASSISNGDTTHAPDGNSVFDALALKRDELTTFRRLTVDHTLDATDLANVNAGQSVNIEMNVGSANTVTIPPNATQAFATGTKIIITWYGVGQTSLLAGAGVTINPSAGAGVLTIPSRYTSVVIEKVGTNEWYLKNGPVSPSAPVWQDWGASLSPTGFSSVAVQKSFYTTDGNTVHIWYEISGTSNATTFTFSLPIAASANYSSVSIVYPTTVQNAGTTQVGRIVIAGGATLVTVDATIAGGTFTNSGTKAIRGSLFYQK